MRRSRPAAAAVVVIGAAISQGALAANFNVANSPLTLHINSLDAQGLGIVVAPTTLKDANGETISKPVLHAALGSGQIDGICMIAQQSILGVTYSVVLSAPSGPERASGANVQFDVESLSAKDVALSNVIIGKSADDISLNGQSLGGQPGGFGLDAANGTTPCSTTFRAPPAARTFSVRCRRRSSTRRSSRGGHESC